MRENVFIIVASVIFSMFSKWNKIWVHTRESINERRSISICVWIMVYNQNVKFQIFRFCIFEFFIFRFLDFQVFHYHIFDVNVLYFQIFRFSNIRSSNFGFSRCWFSDFRFADFWFLKSLILDFQIRVFLFWICWFSIFQILKKKHFRFSDLRRKSLLLII